MTRHDTSTAIKGNGRRHGALVTTLFAAVDRGMDALDEMGVVLL
jgi:hypothetical protein